MAKSGPLMVAITGGSAAGKSTLAGRLESRLADLQPLVIHQDQYFRTWAPDEADQRTANAPGAVGWERLQTDLAALAAGLPIAAPPRAGREPAPPTRAPGQLVIVEGHLLLVDAVVRNTCHLKVYLDVPDEERVLRRVLRDGARDAAALARVVAWYRRDVLDNFHRHTEPTRNLADLVLPANPISDAAFEAVVAAIRASAPPAADGGPGQAVEPARADH